jgi:hypothetical protein
VPFYVRAVALLLAIAVLATAHRILTAAEDRSELGSSPVR